MITLKDIGISLKISDEWIVCNDVPNDIKPYFYKGYKCNDISLHILTYGNLIGEDNF